MTFREYIAARQQEMLEDPENYPVDELESNCEEVEKLVTEQMKEWGMELDDELNGLIDVLSKYVV